MKISTATIQAELDLLEPTEAVAAPYYLKRELDRRKASKRNPGRPVRFTDEQHVKERERVKQYRK